MPWEYRAVCFPTQTLGRIQHVNMARNEGVILFGTANVLTLHLQHLILIFLYEIVSTMFNVKDT